MVWGLAMSPDGQRIASGGERGTLTIWDVDTGHRLLSRDSGQLSIWTLAWSPDGGTIVTGGGNGTIKFWHGAELTGGRSGQRTLNLSRILKSPTAFAPQDLNSLLSQRLAQWDPQNTINSMQLAFALAWTGQTNDYESFCKRVLEHAVNGNDATIERAAKAYLIRGSDPNLVKLAVSLDERAWTIGKDGEFREWIPMNLGLARYRQNDYAEALEILSLPLKVPNPLIKGPSLMIQAMAFKQLGRTDEARASLQAGESLMPPPPPAGQLTETILTQHDHVFFWLLHAEAKALIEGTSESATVQRGR